MHVITLSDEKIDLGYTGALVQPPVLTEADARAMLSSRMKNVHGAADAAARALQTLLALANSKDGILSLFSPLAGQFTTEVRAGAWERASYPEGRPAGTAIARFVLQTGVPYSAGYSGQLGEVAHPVWFYGVENVLCAPLIANAERVGVYWIGRKLPFEPNEIRSLTLVGQAAALLIYQARSSFANQPGD